MLRIKQDLDGLIDKFGPATEKKIMNSLRMSINDAAFTAKKSLAGYAEEVFDNPVALTKNPALVTKGVVTENMVKARVWLKDPMEIAKGIAPTQYLKAQMEGGRRADKRSEKLLRIKGILPPGKQTVIMPDYQNRFGNITAGMIQKILSDLQAYSYSGTTEQNRPTYAYKRLRGRNKYKFRKADKNIKGGIARTQGRFFVIKDKGIFVRKSGQIKAVILFVRYPTYRRRYNFKLAVDTVLIKEWAKRFRYRYARSLGQ